MKVSADRQPIKCALVKHLELRRCKDQYFLCFIPVFCISMKLHKFIYTIREKDFPSSSQEDRQGQYHKEWGRLMVFVQYLTMRSSQLEPIGLQFPPNIGWKQVDDIRNQVRSGEVFRYSQQLPILQKLVILFGEDDVLGELSTSEVRHTGKYSNLRILRSWAYCRHGRCFTTTSPTTSRKMLASAPVRQCSIERTCTPREPTCLQRGNGLKFVLLAGKQAILLALIFSCVPTVMTSLL